MVKVINKDQINNNFYPKCHQTCDKWHSIVFKQPTTNTHIEMDVIDEGNLSDYYCFEIDYSRFEDGEYKYCIDGIEKGILRVGVVKPTTTSFEGNNQGVIYYGED